MCWHFLHSCYVEWHGKTKWRILLHFITCSTASSETQVAVHHSIVVCHFYFQFSNYLSFHSPNFMHMIPFSMATIYFLMQLFEHIVDLQWVTLLRNRFSFPLPKTWLFLLAGWAECSKSMLKNFGYYSIWQMCAYCVCISLPPFPRTLVHSFALFSHVNEHLYALCSICIVYFASYDTKYIN